VIRRGLIFGVLVSLLAAGIAAAAAPAATEGPRLTYLHIGSKPPVIEIASWDAGGGGIERIAGGGQATRPIPFPFSSISWSPDGAALAFAGVSGSLKHAFGSGSQMLFLTGLDGKSPSAIPGTQGAFNPVMSPDGTEVAYLRTKGDGSSSTTLPNGKVHRVYSHSSIWMTSFDGRVTRQLTPWAREIPNTPSSFSPDGSVLGITHRSADYRNSQAVALRVDGSGSSVIAKDAGGPVYSPDGSKIALLRIRRVPYRGDESRAPKFEGTTDLFVVNVDGSGGKRLTHTRAIDTTPAWDPSGRRLAYVRYSTDATEDSFFGFGDAIMEVNADGTCTTEVLSAARGDAFLEPTWQPGPGREAEPIAC
jgi:Tol biopolymer transport system component